MITTAVQQSTDLSIKQAADPLGISQTTVRRRVKETYGSEHYSEIGKKGGTVTSERYGSEHYARIGTKGTAGKQLPDVP